MTNTQNVTELQPRMTREQLIDAARKAAPLLPPAYCGIMKELANRLDYTSVALCEAMGQRKTLIDALTTIANSELLEGETVVCDFSSLVSVAAGALHKTYSSQCKQDIEGVTNNG
ncbi:hypothetical protein [Enterobacter hormaechei]|uniref:hypothetical protein n=1 Tax=Enterobacter hormaechei TaxID=158836 RepID=UPI001FB2F227|nr:hypothetical protein [Enterobacter hormaechei]MCO5775620.1 hypothetical protein [Enterobacter hormaechei]MCR4226451.1 hypothetical protein [Enterobacter hormaechei]MDS0986238.1 hypothetical protein [Enterobacter hormaechei]